MCYFLRVTQLTQDDLNVLRRFVSKFNISVAFFSPQIALIFFLCFITSKYDSKQNLNSSDTLPPSLPHQSAASLFLLRLYSLPTNWWYCCTHIYAVTLLQRSNTILSTYTMLIFQASGTLCPVHNAFLYLLVELICHLRVMGVPIPKLLHAVWSALSIFSALYTSE